MCKRLAILVLLMLPCALLMGCTTTEYLQARYEMDQARRRANMRKTLAHFEERESQANARLGKSQGWFDSEYEQRLDRLERDKQHARELWAQSVDRWESRQDAYRQKVAEELAGDPETVEITASDSQWR